MKKNLLAIISIGALFLPQAASAAITASSTVYVGSATYVISTNACEQVFELWGAGGGGGVVANSGGGGGGGGAYSRSTSTLEVATSVVLSVGAGSAEDSGLRAGSSTVTVAGTLLWGAEGGMGTSAATAGSPGLYQSEYGQTGFDGGTPGAGNGTGDSGGGGGGGAGPGGKGGNGADASTTAGGGGGEGNGGNNASGTTAGSGGSDGGDGGAGDTNDSTSPGGGAGGSAVTGGGGGGGGDNGDPGGTAGAPGGGSGGGEITGAGAGARGQIKITEWVNSNGCTVAPTVTTNVASGVGTISATINGQITSTGGDNATIRGFAFGSDSTLTTVFATTTESGSFGTGVFSKGISGLLSGITYYYRAYATNSVGTSYGSIQSFTTGTNSISNWLMRLINSRLRLTEGRMIIRQK